MPDRWATLLHGTTSSQIWNTLGKIKKQANQWLALILE